MKFSVYIVDARFVIIDTVHGEAYAKLEGDDWVWVKDESPVPMKVAIAIEQTLKGTRK